VALFATSHEYVGDGLSVGVPPMLGVDTGKIALMSIPPAIYIPADTTADIPADIMIGNDPTNAGTATINASIATIATGFFPSPPAGTAQNTTEDPAPGTMSNEVTINPSTETARS
jgi:hypothetical protein